MLLSLHADALPDSTMRGLSVYTLSDQASDRETAALAVRENRDNFVAGINLSRQPRAVAVDNVVGRFQHDQRQRPLTADART